MKTFLEWMEGQGDLKFGSFMRDGKRYNCAYDPDEFKKGKGYLVRFSRTDPMCLSFYHVKDTARAKTILPLQMALPEMGSTTHG